MSYVMLTWGNIQHTDMKVTYNAKLNAYQVIYKDELAALSGGRIYARKQFSAGKKKPTAAERKAKIREYEEWAEEQEENSRLAAEAKVKGTTIESIESGEVPILAADYISNLSGDELTTAKDPKQRATAKHLCNDFVNFLNERYKGLYLHKVNKKVVLEFAQYLDKKGKTYAYKKARWIRLGYVFNMVMTKYEDSELKYRNPFYSLKIDKVAEEEPVNHRKTFSPDIIRKLLNEALTTNLTREKTGEEMKYQRWAIMYLLTLTGIRPKDIMLLKWEQVNLERRTLTIVHEKTKKKGINTVIWLNPHLMELFVTLKELHKNFKACSKSYVFSFFPMEKNTHKVDEYIYIANRNDLTQFFKNFREKYGLTEQVKLGGKTIYFYSVYSLRATVGTLLTWANFNQNSIDYLQGHAPNNTTARFYLNHEANPRAATEDMVNYLAYRVVQQPLGKIGMQYAYNDKLNDDKEGVIQAAISEDIRYNVDGTSLLTHTLLEKSTDEQKKLEEEKERLMKTYGAAAVDAVFHDNSPQV